MGARRRVRGFTLIEVMVATMIVGVSFAGISTLLAQVVRTAATTGQYTQAMLLAASKLDELSVTGLVAGEQNGTFENESGFAWSLKAEPSGEDDVLLVSLTVSFRGPGGKREMTLQTMHADRTLAKRGGRETGREEP